MRSSDERQRCKEDAGAARSLPPRCSLCSSKLVVYFPAALDRPSNLLIKASDADQFRRRTADSGARLLNRLRVPGLQDFHLAESNLLIKASDADRSNLRGHITSEDYRPLSSGIGTVSSPPDSRLLLGDQSRTNEERATVGVSLQRSKMDQ